MAPKRRRILLADRRLQGTVLTHTVLYWFYCLFSVCFIAMCWVIFTSKPTSSGELIERLLTNFGPALLGSVLLLPLVVMDCLRLSNRFAGPMIRLRRAVEQLAAGERPEPVQLRNGDFWEDFADQVNQLIRRMDEAGMCGPPEDNARNVNAEDASDAAQSTIAPLSIQADTTGTHSAISV